MQRVSKQRFGKYISDRDMKAVTASTIETVFSLGSVQSVYKRRE
jgi:hypothetical protein